MQSKGVIKLLAILLAIACIYQLSFSLKARSVEKKAAEYAAKVSESDSLRQAAEIYYLDSVQNRPVYDLGFISFTYKEVRKRIRKPATCIFKRSALLRNFRFPSWCAWTDLY